MTEKLPKPFDSNPLDALVPKSRGDWKTGKILQKNYEVQRILGEGGMGKVYLVYSDATDEFLAVKTLLRESLNPSTQKRLFIRELKTWMSIPGHPNITACRYFRTIEDKMAIFSEFVDGGSLYHWVEQKKLVSLEHLLDIAIQIARGIDAAHEQGVIHQDIKPSNVLITQDRIAKITDFGLARARQLAGVPANYDSSEGNRTFLISSGGMTPAFCSPEQAENGKISRKTDIWSYGLTVLQMFIGSVTWRLGCLARDVFSEYLQSAPHRPYPTMPQTIQEVIWKCLEFNPIDRWASCADIADRLTEIYFDLTGSQYFRGQTAPVTLLRHTVASDRITYPHWTEPAKWINRLSQHMDSSREMPEHWKSEPATSVRIRAICDLEIYEDLVSTYVRHIQDNHYELVFELAELLIDKAHLHQFIDDLPGAIDQLRKSISLQLEMKPQIRKPRNRLRLAESFQKLSHELLRKKEYSDCLKCSETGLKLIEGIDQNQNQGLIIKLKLLLEQARAQYFHEQFTHALQSLDKAEVIIENLRNSCPLADIIQEISGYQRVRGVVYRSLKDLNQARDALSGALALFEQLPSESLTPDQLWEKASLHMNLANLYSYIGEPEACLKNHDSSIAIKTRLIDSMGWECMAVDLSVDLMNKAVSLENLQRYDEALELLDRSAAIKEEVVNYFGRTELENDLSWVYLNKSMVLYGLGKRHESLDYISRAAQIKERLMRIKGKEQMAQQLSMVYGNQAMILQDIGNLKEAEAILDKGISIRRHLVFQQGRNDIIPGLANLLTCKGSLFYEQDRFEDALSLTNEAIELLTPVVKVNAHPTVTAYFCNALMNKAKGYFKAKDFTEGLIHLERANDHMEHLVFTEKKPQFLASVVSQWISHIETLVESGNRSAAIQKWQYAQKQLEINWPDSIQHMVDNAKQTLTEKAETLFPGES